MAILDETMPSAPKYPQPVKSAGTTDQYTPVASSNYMGGVQSDLGR